VAPAGRAAAQGAPPAGADSAAAAAPARAPRPAPVFETEAPLAVTFTADLGRLRRDGGADPPWRDATLAAVGPDGRSAALAVRARARGVWRRRHCAFPPLRLDVPGRAARGTPFEGLDRPKLVNYCHDDDAAEQYVLQELQLYRAFALLAPVAHRTRLLRATYVDGPTGRPLATRYAFLLEEPKAMAARVGGAVVDAKGAKAADLDPAAAAVVGLFQFMIGNGDWSAAGLHNAEIVRDAAFANVLVPYDFDFSGAVDARYAVPLPQLGTRTVRERVYRGHCAPPEAFARAAAHFRERRAAVYALYADPIGRLLRPSVVRETLAYFDDFYRTLDSPAAFRNDVVGACRDVQ
jgi:hypothetical protein